MRFAKYDLDFSANENEGTTPAAEIVTGVFYCAQTTIVGNFFGNPTDQDLSSWNFVEITKDEVLALAAEQSLSLSFDDAGAAFITPPTTTPIP
jgi:hypothetical protein